MNVRSLILLALVPFGIANAARPDPIEPTPDTFYIQVAQPILPYRGMYYEPGRGGTGLSVDVDKNGFVFAIFYGYAADGRPTYYLMEGRFKANDERERIRTGVLGSLEAVPYTTSDGECLGQGCRWQTPVRASTTLEATITWTAERRAELRIGGQKWQLQAAQYTVSDADALEGQWIFNGVSSTPEMKPQAPWGALTITRHHGSVSAHDFDMLPHVVPSAIVYDVRWNRIPHNAANEAGDHFYALYDPSSGRIQIVQAFLLTTGAVSRPSALPFALLYLDGPQVMRGREERPTKSPASYESYSVLSDITLVRAHPIAEFPDSATR